MATFTLEETSGVDADGNKKEFPLIPEDSILEANVLEIKGPVEMPYKDKETNEAIFKMEWTFKIASGEYADQRTWGQTGIKFAHHPDCKLYAWTQEVLGVDLPAGFNLDTDNLLGLPCRIVVGVRSYTKTGETALTYRNYVKDVIRAESTAGRDEDPF